MTEEAANYVINNLPLHLQEYARAYLAYLKGGAPMPDIKTFGVSYAEGQQARIKIAALL
jgi:hypothetical protein